MADQTSEDYVPPIFSHPTFKWALTTLVGLWTTVQPLEATHKLFALHPDASSWAQWTAAALTFLVMASHAKALPKGAA